MEQSVESNCKLISELFELSVFFFNVLELEPAICREIPVIRKTLFFENYISMSVVSNRGFEGTIIVGPSLPFTLFEHKING